MATPWRSRRSDLRLLRIAILAMVALAALVAPAAVATAAGPTITATYTPNEITMAPGETRTAVLLVENPMSLPVRINSLTPLSGDSRVDLSLDTTGPIAIPPGGSAAFKTTVTLSAVPSSKVTALTTVDYTTVPPRTSKVAARTGSVVASLAVTAGPVPSAPASPLTITSAGDDGLVDTQFADVYFTITNTSASDLNLSRATLTFPSFLRVQLPESGLESERDAGTLELSLNETLTTGDGAAVHLHVRTPDGLQPGNARLVLSISYQDAAARTTGFTTGSHTLALTVFGEAAVLGAFGEALAPALFVVPGVLFVLVLWFLWGRVYPRSFAVDLTPPSAVTSAVAVAILGVLFSVPLPPLYTLLWQRDYRAVYGFVDIGRMCLLGVGLGVVAWGAGLAIRGVVRQFRLIPGDPALKVLRKITRRGRNLAQVSSAQHAAKAAAGVDSTVFILRTDRAGVLVCPPILAAPQNDSDTKFAAEFNELIKDQRNRELYRLIRKRGAAGSVVYRTAAGSLSRVPATELSDFGSGRIVDLKS